VWAGRLQPSSARARPCQALARERNGTTVTGCTVGLTPLNNHALHKPRENPILHRNMNPFEVLQPDGALVMTSASMTFGRPARLGLPRGWLGVGGLAALLIGLLRRLDRWQLSLQTEQPRDAEDVLAWATRIEKSDPSFAADLRAAALRSMEPTTR
jgi:hypothetical protein